MKRILAIFVVLLLLLSGCKPSVPPLAEGLDSPILQDVERKPFVYTQEGTPCEEDVEDIPNRASRQFLETFHISLDGMDSATVLEDEHGRTVYALKNDKVEIVFDEDGELVNFREWGSDSGSTEDDFRYQTQADVQDVLDTVVETIDIPQKYELEFRNAEYYLEATWRKKEQDGTLNRYDYFSVQINAVDGSLDSFTRVTGIYELNATEPLVTKEQALEFARPVVEQTHQEPFVLGEPTLGYVRPNFRWEEGAPYAEATFIRLAWSVQASHTEDHEYFPGKGMALIYIDARTGEVLGGESIR